MLMAQLTPADEHDIRAAQEMLVFIRNSILLADKAYCNQS
jgi:hypothetical protein